MSPRFVARDRLELALAVVSLAFDRDGVSTAEAAEVLGVSEELIAETIAPVTDLEYVSTAGTYLDDIGHSVVVEDGQISVNTHWLTDLTSIAPGEAALLIAMIDTADAALSEDNATLMALRRRLEPIASIYVTEAVPEAVEILLDAQRSGTVISARYEHLNNVVDHERTLYEVHGVQCTTKGWRVLVTEYPTDASVQVTSRRLESLHQIEKTIHKFERRTIVAPPQYSGSSRTVEVDIEVPNGQRWLLSYFDPQFLSRGDTSSVVRISIDGGSPLQRLLLRLGPQASVLAPPELVTVGARAAERILSLYQEE